MTVFVSGYFGKFMSEKENKPWLATELAKSSFGLALAGGGAGSICRLDALGLGVQGDLAVLTFFLCLVAMLFAIIALVRITAADAKTVFILALFGLVLGLYGHVMLRRWYRENWSRLAAYRQTL